MLNCHQLHNISIEGHEVNYWEIPVPRIQDGTHFFFFLDDEGKDAVSS
ncbi:hypothetical protein QG37_04082 [Candidozyma auris]|uniref:Uncharacterized protein n=1 Tax=Candidozyma auris TaxID=498019 RepID=A0A0L0NZB1_CANAR|nr:hypothetical protein QG37_04082 [[Candida] auris]